MTHIAYVDLRDLEPYFDALYRAVSPARRQRADLCRHGEALQCLVGDALLRYAAKAWSIGEYTLGQNPWGKPLLTDVPGFHFNISHSGRYAAIAWGGREVGIDLEILRPRDAIPSLAQRYFTVPEQKYVLAQDSLSRFYQVWTAKESWLKYQGTGLTRPLTGFCTRSPQCQQLLHCFFPEENCCLTVCTGDACTAPVRLSAEVLIQ